MSKQLDIKLPWPPTVNTYWRSVVLPRKNKRTGAKKASSVVLLSQNGRAYRDRVAQAVLVQRVPRNHLHGKLKVEITAYPPDLRARDLDNLPKGILDSLKHAGVYRDDCDIDDLHIRRATVRKGGAIEISISVIPGVHMTSSYLFDTERA